MYTGYPHHYPRAPYQRHGLVGAGVPADDGQPSMALTISVLSEDVYATWLHLLGEAVAQEEPFVGREEEREHLLLSLRRSSKGTPSAGPAGGAALRASLPRALLAPCERTARRRFTNPHAAWDEWRHAARDLLVEAWGGGGEGVSRAPPAWVASLEATDPLAERLDAVLLRKRTPCHGKLDQISAFLEATAGRTLDGRPQPDIDIDAIFQIEKRDKSYIPADRRWFRPREW
ncbi:hypothetical protein AB1Y20_003645 [Prymnesium parvum]|uniref:Uncharacterized protein n=1 Tax=Prymnesium parvum TaxID=97485 RepID=A0AB34J7G1_PRYPA